MLCFFCIVFSFFFKFKFAFCICYFVSRESLELKTNLKTYGSVIYKINIIFKWSLLKGTFLHI